jgi:calcium/calmodulin-dependent protein kinase I
LLFKDLKKDSDIMVTDFGLSKDVNGDMLVTTCGSPHYVAPEVLKAAGHSKPVDMWALGVITYVLLCGYTPFWGGEANSNTVLYQAICSGKFEFDEQYWSQVSPEAKQFISKLLIIDPSKRMTASEASQDCWLDTTAGIDLLPHVRKNFNARRTFKKGSLFSYISGYCNQDGQSS